MQRCHGEESQAKKKGSYQGHLSVVCSILGKLVISRAPTVRNSEAKVGLREPSCRFVLSDDRIVPSVRMISYIKPAGQILIETEGVGGLCCGT